MRSWRSWTRRSSRPSGQASPAPWPPTRSPVGTRLIVSVIGAGAQGHLQLRHLTLVRSIRRVTVYDVEASRARDLARWAEAELDLKASLAGSVQAAVAEADIVVAATWSQEPFLFPAMLRPGTHVTTLGADEPGKAEASRELLEAAVVICDDVELAAEKGALAAVGLGPEVAAGDLTDVLNRRPTWG